MPRVPVTPLNSVAPAQNTTARFQPADNGGGVAGQLGDAMGRMGEAINDFAVQQDEIDKTFDDTTSRALALEYQKRSDPLLTEYVSLTGVNAVERRAEIDAELATIRDETLGRATNDRMREFTSMRIEPLHMSATSKVGTHATQQNIIYRDETKKAQVSNSYEQAMSNWQDPELFQQWMDTGLSVIEDMAFDQGWSQETLESEQLKFQSDIHTGVVKNMIGEEDYLGAADYLKANADLIDEADEDVLWADMKPGLDYIQASDDADAAFAAIQAGADTTATVGVDGGGGATGGGPASALVSNKEFADSLIGVESNGSYTQTSFAKRKRDGKPVAYGKYQFTESTWVGQYAAMKGVSRADAQQAFNQGKWKDPDSTEAMMEFTANGYRRDLKAAGLPETKRNMYLAHGLGPQLAVKVLKADANTSIYDILVAHDGKGFADEVLAKNGDYYRNKDGTPKKVGEVLSHFDKKMGGGGAAAKPAAAAEPAKDVSFKWQNPVGATARTTSKFGEARDKGPHSGWDIAGNVGDPLKPMGPGKVKQVGYDAASGNFIIIDHGNGHTSSYSHLKDKPSLAVGAAVDADTTIGLIGMTGRTSGPHVHVVVRKDGARIDPESLIGQDATAKVGGGAAGGGTRQVTVPGKQNLGQVFDNLDARAEAENWTPQRLERAKIQARRKIEDEEMIVQIDQREADRQADAIVTQLGRDFTDITLIPIEIRNKMSPEALNSQTRVAMSFKENKEQVKPDGEASIYLHSLMMGDPEKFAEINLSEYADQLTPSERSVFAGQQASIRRAAEDKAKADEAAAKGKVEADKLQKDAQVSQARANVFNDAYGFVGKMTAGRKDIDDGDRREIARAMTPKLREALEDGIITDEEMREAYVWGTRTIKTTEKGLFGDTSYQRPIYNINIDNIAPEDAKAIRSLLRKRGLPSDDEAVMDHYRQFYGTKSW